MKFIIEIDPVLSYLAPERQIWSGSDIEEKSVESSVDEFQNKFRALARCHAKWAPVLTALTLSLFPILQAINIILINYFRIFYTVSRNLKYEQISIPAPMR